MPDSTPREIWRNVGCTPLPKECEQSTQTRISSFMGHFWSAATPKLVPAQSGTSLAGSAKELPPHHAHGSISHTLPQSEWAGAALLHAAQTCPCFLQKAIYKGPWGLFVFLSQICSYCLIYKYFVLSLLLLFLDYSCVPPAFLLRIIESWPCACSVPVSGPKWEWE